jgi:hypothetical protein
MVVTKRDPFLRSRITDSNGVKTVVVITRPLGNLCLISTKGANEVSYHSIQLVVLPGDEYECFVVLPFRKLLLQASNIFIAKVRANRQAQSDCRWFNRGKWSNVIKLA